MSKRYEIEKITDILEIPEESFGNFLIDLKAYYDITNGINELVKAAGGVTGVDVSSIPKRFIWIDDGKHDAKVHLTKETS